MALTRRRFLAVSAIGASAPRFAIAQARRVKVGMLSARVKSTYTASIKKRLAVLGYVEGSGMTFEYRHATGATDRFSQGARELIALGCDVILAIGPAEAALALRSAGARMPIVFLASDYDPVKRGLVESLARPGRNFTGVYAQSPLIGLKRLELAQEITSASHFLVLSDIYTQDALPGIRSASSTRGFQLTLSEFRERPYRYDAAFESARRSSARAVIVLTSPVLGDDRHAIAALAAKHRLASVGFVLDDAFLIGHSANTEKLGQRTAEIAVKILEGAKPADIPVHQADEFDLVVNLRIAGALGIKVPNSVLARATRLVE